MASLDEQESSELVDFRCRFWWTLALSVTVFALAMFGHFLFPMGLPNQNLMELALSAPVVLWTGWPFFVRWWQSLRKRSVRAHRCSAWRTSSPAISFAKWHQPANAAQAARIDALQNKDAPAPSSAAKPDEPPHLAYE